MKTKPHHLLQPDFKRAEYQNEIVLGKTRMDIMITSHFMSCALAKAHKHDLLHVINRQQQLN